MIRNPIILMCFHRSGSTYLTRLLNTNPQVMVWGEHGGFIAGLLNSSNSLEKRLYPRCLRTDVDAAKKECVNSFIPFMNGFTHKEYEQGLAQSLHGLFSKGLQPSVRWGFKEIRYLSNDMIDFLVRMFPEAKLTFLLRDPTELCISNIRAPWVIERLVKGHNGYNHTKLREVLYNILVRIRMHQQQYQYALKHYPGNTVLVEYEKLTEDPYNEMLRINEALEIDRGHVFSREDVIATTSHKIGRGVSGSIEGCPELEVDSLLKEIVSLSREMDRYKVLPYLPIDQTWNFCIGIMPIDSFSFQSI